MKSTHVKTLKATCPTCKAIIHLESIAVEEDGYVDCTNCGGFLKILTMNPLKLSVAFFDDEYDDDDEF